jgi:hypothetical protein
MEEIKFERAEGTWAAAPGLDWMSVPDNGCGAPYPRLASGSTASSNGGCRVYSKMTLSPDGEAWRGSCRASRQTRDEWSGMEAVAHLELVLEMEGPSFPWARSVSRCLDRTRAMLVRSCAECAHRIDERGFDGHRSAEAPTTEYTGEPLWPTGTVSKIC